MLPQNQHNGIGSTTNSSHSQDLFRSRPTVVTTSSGGGGENDSRFSSGHNSIQLERTNQHNNHHMSQYSSGNNRNNRLPLGSSSGGNTAGPAHWKTGKSKKNSDCEEPDDTKVLLDNHTEPVVDEDKQSERVSSCD